MNLQPLARLKMGAAFFTPVSNSASMPGFTSICAISRIMVGLPLAGGRRRRGIMVRACNGEKTADASFDRAWHVQGFSPRVLPTAEEAILLVVAGLVTDRLERGDLGVGALDGVAAANRAHPFLDGRILARVDREQFEIAQPRERSDVGDRVVVAGDIGTPTEQLLVNIKQLDDLRAVAP